MGKISTSFVWVISGIYLIFLGFDSYWGYSEPNTVWLGKISELFPVAHIYIGIKAILVGVKLQLCPLNVKEDLMDFLVILIVFTAIVFGRELLIYGMLVANDYVLKELYLWLFSGLIFMTWQQLKKNEEFGKIWNQAFYQYRNGIRFKSTIIKFVISIIVLPWIFRYEYFEFLH